MPGGGMDRKWGDLQFYIDNGWCPMWDTKDEFDMHVAKQSPFTG